MTAPDLLFEGHFAPGETRDLEATATTPAYNTLLIESWEGFEVRGLHVDDESQFVTDMPVPAAAFKDTFGIRLSLGIKGGSKITLRMHNTGAECDFRAKMLALPGPPRR